MERALLLNVVVGQGTTILQLLTSEDQALLVRGDTLLVLNLRLHVVDRVRRLHLKGDSLTRQCLDKDLHTTTETKHYMIDESACKHSSDGRGHTKVESGLLLDVVVRKSAAVLQLLAGEDQTLLVGRDALLVLDLRLDIVDGVGGLDLKGDGLAGQRLHEDLHTSTETED